MVESFIQKKILSLELRQWLIAVGSLGLLLFIFSKGPISQPPHYHNFADARGGIVPNWQNVFSNLIFILVGYFAAFQINFNLLSKRNQLYISTFFVGVYFTGFGSIYYHLNPNTETLFWDRLPMSVGFASFTFWLLSKTVLIKIQGKLSEIILFWFYIFFAAGTTVYWMFTESNNMGDLRPYFFVQFFSILAALLVVVFYSEKIYPRSACFYLFIFYVLAKITEKYDHQIFGLTAQFTSGHVLKHILAGLGCWIFLHYLSRWIKTATQS